MGGGEGEQNSDFRIQNPEWVKDSLKAVLQTMGIDRDWVGGDDVGPE
jgi:hypothetical protein